ncbi:glycerate kinase [Halobacillus halophilus]|uniref:glycerate kinase n=1 Tax=Halobacillus halophilus TaxID=1570 RepID=UPI001CD43C21|nr:glycerate kinase [Halobacillus halophilus]MCA1010481.1 glycerate kinase [Halobacillus halophilus]
MKVVFAPDSFKGSLTSVQVSEIMKQAFLAVNPETETILKPMADGGEGTLDALSKASDPQKVSLTCTGPLGEKVESSYIEFEDQRAVIEGAAIAGLPLVPEEKRNPDYTTTYGIGEAILHALNRGHRELMIAIGGSSTNDGGLGMLQALGMKTFNNQGKETGGFGKDLFHIKSIDFSSIDARLKNTTIRVASDVDNPLTGPKGASHIYGPQKGASEKQVTDYDQALAKYGTLVEKASGRAVMNSPGAGAAGGLGFAFLSIGASLESGARLISEAIHLPEEIQGADLVVTGEGQSDKQTMYGKAPGYVAEVAKQYNKPALLLSGSLDGDYEELNQVFTGCFSVVPGPRDLTECMDHAEEYLYKATIQLARLVSEFKK